MEAVFDGPMAANQLQQTGRIGFLWSQAGKAIDGFATLFLSDNFGGLAFDAEDLGGIREGEISRQFGAGPDVADFQSAMGLIGGGMVRGEKPSNRGRRCLAGGLPGYLLR